MKNILSKEQMDFITKEVHEWGIEDYNINSDGSVDVNHSVEIWKTGASVTEIPIKFNIIHGDFIYTDSYLESLKNMPNVVTGNFDISSNTITSLVGCPHTIGGDFDFKLNNLESTYVGDYDVTIGGIIDCHGNNFDLIFQGEISTYLEEEENEDGDIGDLQYNSDLIKLVFKYQRHFEIWNGQGLSINDKNFQEFLDEVNEGLQ